MRWVVLAQILSTRDVMHSDDEQATRSSRDGAPQQPGSNCRCFPDADRTFAGSQRLIHRKLMAAECVEVAALLVALPAPIMQARHVDV